MGKKNKNPTNSENSPSQTNKDEVEDSSRKRDSTTSTSTTTSTDNKKSEKPWIIRTFANFATAVFSIIFVLYLAIKYWMVESPLTFERRVTSPLVTFYNYYNWLFLPLVVYIVLVVAGPFTTLWSQQRHVLLILSFIGFLLFWKPFLWFLIVSGQTWQQYIEEIQSTRASSLIYWDYVFFSFIAISLILISWKRYPRLNLKKAKNAWNGVLFIFFYIFTGMTFGFDITLPLFLVALLSVEQGRTHKEFVDDLHEFGTSIPIALYFIFGSIAFVGRLAGWNQFIEHNITFVADSSFLQKVFHILDQLIQQATETHGGESYLRSHIILSLAAGLYSSSSMFASKTIPYLLKWVFAIVSPLGFVFFPSSTFAAVLIYREIQPGHSFYTRDCDYKPTYMVVYLWSSWKIFVFISVFASFLSAVGLRYSFILIPLLLIAAFFIIKFITGWGFNPEPYENWILQFPNLLLTICAFISFTLITIFAWSHVVINMPALTKPIIDFEKGASGIYYLGMVAVLIHSYRLSKDQKNGRFISRIWHILPILTVILGIFASKQNTTCSVKVGQESILPHLNQTFEEYDCVIKDIVDTKCAHGKGPAYRVEHARALGCALAELTVSEYVPDKYRHGLFAQSGKKFDTFVRYSPGSSNYWTYDNTPPGDVHGMAMKVVGVPGERLLDGPQFENTTQDFVMVNSPVFFTGSVEGYPSLLRAQELEGGIPAVVKWALSSPLFFNWNLSIPVNAMMMALRSQKMTNPLSETYFSTTPYRIGPDENLAIKFSARPCHNTINQQRKEKEVAATRVDRVPVFPWNLFWKSPDPNPNYITDNMYSQLAQDNEGACFELRVQEQHDPCHEPMEDPTIEWTTPFITLATLTIPPQQYRTVGRIDMCEDLSFNPWNGIVDHKPLGNVNTVRKISYLKSSTLRRHFNHQPLTEPTSSEWQAAGDTRVLPLASSGAGNVFDFEFQPYDPPYVDLPRHVRTLPKSQTFDAKKLSEILTNITAGEFIQVPETVTNEFHTFQDYHDLLLPNASAWRFGYQLETIQKLWREDATFAQQTISGINPMVIKVLADKQNRRLPLVFNLDNNLNKINAHLARVGEDSFQVLKEGSKVFFTDYEILNDLHIEANRIAYPGIGLFYQNKKGQIMPLAIQLSRKGDGSDYVFTPDEENEHVWLFAKMHLASSDAQTHETVSHLDYTHLTMEPFIIGFNRQLKADHPLLEMMKPHFHFTLAINDLGRNTLLAHDGYFDQITNIGLTGTLDIMNTAFKRWDFVNNSFPRDLERRGFFEDKREDHLDSFYYRDDGFKIWNAMTNYCRSMTNAVYDSDEAVLQDKQLQALISEIKDPRRGNVPSVPELTTRESVAFFLNTLLWIGSSQHSAVNFGQEDFYAFIPNRPLYMIHPMPEPQYFHTIDENYIVQSLAPRAVAKNTITIVHTLSLPPDPNNGVIKGLNDDLHPSSWKYIKYYQDFQKELKAIQAQIAPRNDKLEKAGQLVYRYLEPAHIASSIAI